MTELDINFNAPLDRCAMRSCNLPLPEPPYNGIRAEDASGNVIMARLCRSCLEKVQQSVGGVAYQPPDSGWQHADYLKTYEHGFFHRADGWGHLQAGQIRCGDALAALCYALGFSSFEQVQTVFGFSGEGREVGCSPATFAQMMDGLWAWQTRKPKHVIDVGGGRGEVACCLHHLGVSVQMVEPHPLAPDMLKHTWGKLFKVGTCPIVPIPLPVPECLPSLDLGKMDTVIFCESIEHIPQDCFDAFWPTVKAALVKNKGMLIVVNWLSYLPLEVTGREHCRLVDDAFYDELARDGQTVCRKGSHLVVEYGR